MRKVLVLAGFVAVATIGLARLSAGDDRDGTIARFDGGIGVQPVLVNPTTFAAAANIVRGIGPGILPWTIHSLKARLDVDGELEALGRGLVLAAGAPIGTRGDLPSVRALLFCGTSTAPHESAPAALDVDGDFRIEGFLTPAVDSSCPTPTLLIVVGAGTAQFPFRWVAAAIPDNDDND